MKPALLFVTLILGAAACGPSLKALPADLPPPEYEKPRGYDLNAAPTAAPSSAPAAAPSSAPPGR